MRTTASLPDIESIPNALKELPQWVAWKYARIGTGTDNRLKKIPISPRTGQFAKTSLSSGWSDFATALACLNRKPVGLAGIGFMFSRHDPFVGVDLDDCRQPVTGELAPWAEAIAQELDSYAEVSPSGTGVKIILASHQLVPSRRKSSPGIEVYSSDRFFTITGQAIPGFESVHHRTEQIVAMHERMFPELEGQANEVAMTPEAAPDQQVLAKARQARNGRKFEDLWSGRLAYHDDNASQADLGLCRILAFWCGPCPAQIDRLFRQSSLFREKWDERHFANGATYGQETIRLAIAAQNPTYFRWQFAHPG